MMSLLNRGFNFCVTPDEVNVTELLAGVRKFDRKMRWKESWAEKDKEADSGAYEEWKARLFKKEKFNLPTTATSKGLSNFLISTRSEIAGTKFNKAPSNITKEETKALEELIKLQKEQVIVIKPVDKGGGIIITNYQDYVNMSMT